MTSFVDLLNDYPRSSVLPRGPESLRTATPLQHLFAIAQHTSLSSVAPEEPLHMSLRTLRVIRDANLLTAELQNVTDTVQQCLLRIEHSTCPIFEKRKNQFLTLAKKRKDKLDQDTVLLHTKLEVFNSHIGRSYFRSSTEADFTKKFAQLLEGLKKTLKKREKKIEKMQKKLDAFNLPAPPPAYTELPPYTSHEESELPSYTEESPPPYTTLAQ